jgi:DNA-binding NarL/FixJ family response regulator
MSQPPCRLLLIDDDLVDRLAIVRLLSRAPEPWSIEECGDGTRLGEAAGFDAILLDYSLPQSTGLELLQRLRASGADTPVIALSGQRDQRIAIELLRHGATDYLIKDALTGERLHTTLVNAIAACRAQRQARRHERALRLLVEGTAPTIGSDFFQALTRLLADAFTVRQVLVAEVIDDGRTARCLAMNCDGVHVAGGEYALAEAPCRAALTTAASVAGDATRLRFHGVQPCAPAAHYRGLAIRDDGGSSIGVLALLHDQPIPSDAEDEALLTVFAARAAAEIRRLRAETALAGSLRLEKGLAACARILLADAHPPRTLILALQHLLAAASAHTVTLYENEDDDVLGCCARRTAQAGASDGGDERLAYRNGLRRWENDLSSGIPVHAPVHLLPANEQSALVRAGIGAVLALPLHIDGRWAGFLRLDHRLSGHRWLKEELNLLRNVAELIGIYCGRRGVPLGGVIIPARTIGN